MTTHEYAKTLLDNPEREIVPPELRFTGDVAGWSASGHRSSHFFRAGYSFSL